MVRKEDLCNWFKALPAHKRVDHICGLLRLCLPLELRFIGTVLEDLAKKDFRILRDQEIKANQRSDLSSNNSNSLSDKKLRAKIITTLALMSSNNSPCAEVVFEILRNEFKNVVELLQNSSDAADDLSMILTMAVRHPAFSFYQRNQLGQVLERVEAYIQPLFGDDLDDGSSLITQTQTSDVQHCSFRSSQSYGPHLEKDTRQEASSYHRTVLIPPYPSVVSYAHCSSERSQMSSTASSPDSSRTSSPSPLTFHGESKNNCTTSGAAKANHMAVSGFGILQPVHIADQTFQLLHILNLEEYYDNLKDYPFHQIFQMSKEDFAKAGLPPEVQTKLQSCLSQVGAADINGIVDSNRQPLPETFYAPPYPYSYAQISQPYLQHFIHPSAYAAQTGQITLLPSPHVQPHPHDSSSTSSDTSSRPQSPLVQSFAGLSLDHSQTHMIGQLPPVARHQMMLPLMASHAGPQTVLDMKHLQNKNADHADSSGSEDDRSHGLFQKPGIPKTKGNSKPQQSQSAPLVNQSSYSNSALEASKLTDMLISMTTPHGYPSLLTASEVRINRPSASPPFTSSTNHVAGAPPHVSASPAIVANEHQSDPSIIPRNEASQVDPRTIMSPRTFQTAPPSHSSMGLHSDSQYPFLSHEKGGPNAMSLPGHHGSLPFPSYIPLASSIPSTHVIGLNPGNYQYQNTLQQGPQPYPTPLLIPDAGRGHPRYFIMYPRGINTTIANSSSVTITTQSHPSRPHVSHTSSPVVPNQTSTYVAETVDPRPEESGQTAAHVGALKSPSHTGGSNSCRSSPPFLPAPQKQPTTETPVGGRGSQVVGFINGFGPRIIHPQSHRPQQQLFPNGITSDYAAWLQLQLHIAPSYYPVMYGSMGPQSSHPGTPPATTSPCATTTSTTNQSHSSSISDKSKCYNCGHGGHDVSDCQESRMETMSNTFHLRYNSSEPPV